jgi:hypothetical protein
VPLVREGAIEVAVEDKVSNFLLLVALQKKLARAQAASNGKVQKQRVAQHIPSSLARCEVAL